MSNIAGALVELAMVAANCATPQQQAFIMQLIEDLQPHVRRPIYSRGFLVEESQILREKLLGRKLSDDEYDQVCYEIDTMNIAMKTLVEIGIEITEELKKCAPPSEYANVLSETLRSIKAQRNSKLELLRARNKDPESLDQLYNRTIHEFNGSVMLPIQQGLDPRNGTSSGECSGFVAVWAKAWLENKAPFGIQPTQAPPFNVVNFQFPAAKVFPDINNLAIITPQVAQLQRADKYPLIYDIYNLKKLHLNITYYDNSSEIAEKLIQITDQSPSDVYGLIIRKYREAHEVGFKKDHLGNYHFYDINSGWIRFGNANDFRKWLCFYWQKSNYERYVEYSIARYQRKLENVQPMSFGERLIASTKSIIWWRLEPTRMLTYGIYRHLSLRNIFANNPAEIVESRPSPTSLSTVGNSSINTKINPQSATPSSYKVMLNVLDTNHAQAINIKSKKIKYESDTILLTTNEDKRNFQALDLAPATITIPPSNTENLAQDALDLALSRSLKLK